MIEEMISVCFGVFMLLTFAIAAAAVLTVLNSGSLESIPVVAVLMYQAGAVYSAVICIAIWLYN